MQRCPSEFSIIYLKEKDADELAALEAACFSTAFDGHAYRRILQKETSVFTANVINDGPTDHAHGSAGADSPSFESPVIGMRNTSLNKLVAYISLGVSLGAGEMEVFNIAVHKKFRRRGLGMTLLSLALERAEKLGVTKAFLEVRVSNEPAVALYGAAGFAIAGQRNRYYQDTGEDALVLVCALDEWKIMRDLNCLR